MSNLKLETCPSCGSEYKKMLGKELNKLTKEICPCCDSKRHEMVMDHLKEENSTHFSEIKFYRNMLDNISDEDFTPQLREKIFEIVGFTNYSYQEEDIDLILNSGNYSYQKAA